MCEDADIRYEQKIPPGFLDTEKDKNATESKYQFGALSYIKKYGDLILWRELLSYAKRAKLKHVLFVTGDRKSDWWWREQGRTLGPHPLLRQEIYREAGVETFWMYSADQFLDLSQRYTQAKVSPTSVQELQEIQDAPQQISKDFLREPPAGISSVHIVEAAFVEASGRAIYDILQATFPSTSISTEQNFPDFLINTDRGRYGVSVANLAKASPLTIGLRLKERVMQGLIAKLHGELQEYTVFAVFTNIPDELGLMRNRLTRLINQYPIDSIIVGHLENQRFKQLFKVEQTA